MNKEALLKKRAATETRFSELRQEQDNLNKQLTGVNEEIFRLQGEYRTLTTLIDEQVSKESKKEK